MGLQVLMNCHHRSVFVGDVGQLSDASRWILQPCRRYWSTWSASWMARRSRNKPFILSTWECGKVDASRAMSAIRWLLSSSTRASFLPDTTMRWCIVTGSGFSRMIRSPGRWQNLKPLIRRHTFYCMLSRLQVPWNQEWRYQSSHATKSEKDVPRIMVRVGIRKYKRCAFACSCSYAQKIPEATSSISQEASKQTSGLKILTRSPGSKPNNSIQFA